MAEERPKGLLRDQSGVSAIEYALLAGLIAVVIIVAVASVGVGVRGLYENVSDHVTAVTGGGSGS